MFDGPRSFERDFGIAGIDSDGMVDNLRISGGLLGLEGCFVGEFEPFLDVEGE